MKNQRERGSTIIEFALVAPLLMLTFFGTVGLGLMLGRHVQTVQACRDLAHMYVDGVDFTQTASQSVALQLTGGTGMTATGGNGVVIFSRVITVYQADCDAAGISPCTNLGRCVFTQRILLGNSSLRASAFGTPSSTILNAQGNISASVYLSNSDSSVITTGISTLLTNAGQTSLIPQGNAIWVTEAFFPYPEIGFLGMPTASGSYARFLY